MSTNGSTRQLARDAWVYALAKRRRQDGWTSTPRASTKPTAETTPQALLVLVSAALWILGPSAKSNLGPGSEVVGAYFA